MKSNDSQTPTILRFPSSKQQYNLQICAAYILHTPYTHPTYITSTCFYDFHIYFWRNNIFPFYLQTCSFLNIQDQLHSSQENTQSVKLSTAQNSYIETEKYKLVFNCQIKVHAKHTKYTQISTENTKHRTQNTEHNKKKIYLKIRLSKLLLNLNYCISKMFKYQQIYILFQN